MGDVVLVAYRPKPGCEAALLELLKDHVPHLRRLGLATNRPALALSGRDGIIVEMFEWEAGAIATAHQQPEILQMWERYAAVCDYVPLNTLAEAADLFAQFKPMDLETAA